ncbi:hypothetical protein ACTFIR_009772 [Dictyostelium discoideum]
MDNGAASNELFQLLLPTHNQSVKNNDKIEGETLKKLIHRNFRSKTLVPVKTDYEAAKIKVVDAISNIAIKLNTQTDITELVLNNTEKLSRRPSDSTSNTDIINFFNVWILFHLSEDEFKKLIIIYKETIHTVIREYHDTNYGGHYVWANTMDSKLKMTVAHREQADGQTERMNREIKRILTKAST